jgi:DNA repair photolyase
MVNCSEVTAASMLVPQKSGSLSGGYDYTLNPYAGCAFRCSYCYVPKFPNGKHHFSEWGNWVEAKINAPQLLQKERAKIFGSRIFFGSATDPYQYVELKYRLSRRCLEQLYNYKPKKITLHTRSHLVLEDIDLLKTFGKTLNVGISITTNNEDIAREFEPGAPSIARRLDLLAKLHAAGIRVHVSMAPLLPCDPEKLVNLIAPYAQNIWIGGMNYPEINNRPHLLQKYEQFFASNNYRPTIQTIQKLFARGKALGDNLPLNG